MGDKDPFATEPLAGPQPSADTEIDDGYGRTTWSQSDPLDAYAFNFNDLFVRWHPWGNERASDTVWQVINIGWRFRTTWLRERDNPTTKADHREYELLSEEFDRQTVTEEELLRGDWMAVDDLDEDARQELAEASDADLEVDTA